jgi:hypothetical protein
VRQSQISEPCLGFHHPAGPLTRDTPDSIRPILRPVLPSQLTTIATSLGMLDASRLIQFIGEISDPRVVSAARIQSLEIRLKEAASTSRGAVARNYDPAAPPSSVKRVRQLEAELADASKFSAGLERQLESGRKEQEALIIALRQEVDEGRTARAQLEAEIATLTTQAQPSVSYVIVLSTEV